MLPHSLLVCAAITSLERLHRQSEVIQELHSPARLLLLFVVVFHLHCGIMQPVKDFRLSVVHPASVCTHFVLCCASTRSTLDFAFRDFPGITGKVFEIKIAFVTATRRGGSLHLVMTNHTERYYMYERVV